jgi:hypothetical protein
LPNQSAALPLALNSKRKCRHYLNEKNQQLLPRTSQLVHIATQVVNSSDHFLLLNQPPATSEHVQPQSLEPYSGRVPWYPPVFLQTLSSWVLQTA